ncbi:hypothetical protein CDD81_5126 [Ophiocordyceps australis]|uniref:Cytochrome oxidase assembly n=1 Tax=Ophiocordyceps australis TaxID=1399860 RepID=A0A2C5YAW2_9HYPO|nr:hypothetical protein CDD81_5126 [Ophiocordyceps australis]
MASRSTGLMRRGLRLRRALDAQRRFLTPAPRPGDGPLMTRRADRALPDVAKFGFRWSRSLPLFLVAIGAASMAIFNYQKSSSPIISASLYALRTSPRARAVLGDDIYFKSPMPWIGGTIDQLHGHVDVEFGVKGSKAPAMMRFKSSRRLAQGLYETHEWSLTLPDGTWVDLLTDGDPFVQLLADELVEVEEARGFRQQGGLNK